MKKFRYIIYLFIFCLGGLLGSQGPAFVDQYSKRVDAHLIEARLNFSGFLIIAEQLHGGSVEALIEHHRKSTDLTFHKEADVIEGIYKRVKLLEYEAAAMASNMFYRSFYVLIRADRSLFYETYNSFSAQITFNLETIAFALIVGLVFCIIFKLFSLLSRGRL